MNLTTTRIHDADVDTSRSRIVKMIDAVVGGHFIVREIEASRPHYQGGHRTELKTAAFRVRVSNAFPECKGNKYVSFKAITDWEGWLTYLCKGARRGDLPDVVFNNLWEMTPEKIEELHHRHWDKEEVKKKDIKDGNLCMIESVLEWAQVHNVDAYTDDDLRRIVVREIIGRKSDRNRGFSVYDIRNISNCVMCRLRSSFARTLEDEVLSRI